MMKFTIKRFVCMAFAQLFFAGICNAQSLILKAAPVEVSIDGDIKEWGDSLNYIEPNTKLRYTIANDKNNLYLVVKVKDKQQQGNILGAGLTFSIDIKGRNKASYVVTYPVKVFDQSRFVKIDAEQAQLEIQSAKYRKLNVEGFSGVDDGPLIVANGSNIQVAIGYDDAGYLVYEEAIPLPLFNAGKLIDKEWAFNIKLNGLQNRPVQNQQADDDKYKPTNLQSALVAVPAGSMPPGVGAKMTSGSRRPIRSSENSNRQLTPSVDFWGKFTLAKVQ